jgi:hypothetical protein
MKMENQRSPFQRKNQSQLLFKKTVLSPKVNIKVEYANHFPSTKKTSVYSPEMTDKSAIHNLIGTHYRKIYGTLIDSKTASLDTLYGGLTPQRAGGGHQTITIN